jgi:hypothetical protein
MSVRELRRQWEVLQERRRSLNKDGNGLPGIDYLRDYGEPPARETAGAEFTADLWGLYRQTRDLRFKQAAQALEELGIIKADRTWNRDYESPDERTRREQIFRLIEERRASGKDLSEAIAEVAVDSQLTGPSWAALMQRLRRLYRKERDKSSPQIVSRHT